MRQKQTPGWKNSVCPKLSILVKMIIHRPQTVLLNILALAHFGGKNMEEIHLFVLAFQVVSLLFNWNIPQITGKCFEKNHLLLYAQFAAGVSSLDPNSVGKCKCIFIYYLEDHCSSHGYRQTPNFNKQNIFQRPQPRKTDL